MQRSQHNLLNHQDTVSVYTTVTTVYTTARSVPISQILFHGTF